MIKLAGYFKSRRRGVITSGLMLFSILTAILLTNSTLPAPRQNTFDVSLFPGRYALYMSHTPGIRIEPDYNDPFTTLRYSTEYGHLFTWDTSTGIISDSRKVMSFDSLQPVYWNPAGEEVYWEENTVLITFLDVRGNIVAEKPVVIYNDEFVYFTTRPFDTGSFEPALEQAVRDAALSLGSHYRGGEFLTEGHKILEAQETHSLPGHVTVFAISSVGWFGFENGVFTKVSGNSAVPVVMTFTFDKERNYTLLGIKEPEPGKGYPDSVLGMFPVHLWHQALNPNSSELEKQQELQAEAYLNSIGRFATVSADYVEKVLPEIDSATSNILLRKAELSEYPYWLGTREVVENGTRYIYETMQSKDADGDDLITYRKISADGTLEQLYQYKIVGGHPRLQNPESEVN